MNPARGHDAWIGETPGAGAVMTMTVEKRASRLRASRWDRAVVHACAVIASTLEVGT